MTAPLSAEQLAEIRTAATAAVERHPSTTFMAPCESLADAVLDAVLPLLLADSARLAARVAELEKEARETDRAFDQTIGERDRTHDAADKLAYAVAPVEVIGEHTGDNDPWDNALDLVVPFAEVEKIRARVAELEAERHATNEALDDAVKALREKACECFSPEFHQPECSQSQTVVDGVEYSFVHWYTDADGTWLLPVSGDELRMQVEGDAAYEPIPLGELLSEYGPLTRTEFYRELSRDEIRQLQAEAGDPR